MTLHIISFFNYMINAKYFDFFSHMKFFKLRLEASRTHPLSLPMCVPENFHKLTLYLYRLAGKYLRCCSWNRQVPTKKYSNLLEYIQGVPKKLCFCLFQSVNCHFVTKGCVLEKKVLQKNFFVVFPKTVFFGLFSEKKYFLLFNEK